MSKAKSLSVLVLLMLSLFTVLPLATALHDPAGTISLKDAEDGDNSLDWDTGAGGTPGTYPNFDLDLELTNVTFAYSCAFSLAWDTSLFDFVSISWGSLFDAAGVTVLPLAGTLNEGAGTYTDASIGQLGPTTASAKNYSDPTWATIATITMQYTGAAPTLGSPVTSQINLTKYKWNQLGDSPVEDDFGTVVNCAFNYEALSQPVVPPTACFTISPSGTVFPGDVLTFDASCSSGGNDGDGVCPITEYLWTWGDTTANTTSSPVITHSYDVAGPYSVCLVVVAPAVGPYTDPSYYNTSTQVCKALNILPKVESGLDLFTEDYRWPCYDTEYTGVGLNNTEVDPFQPQENITLCAEVTWKGSPRQNKLVSFYIEGPGGEVIVKRTAYTNEDGIACIDFRMPWTCNMTYNELYIMGTWYVEATVALPEVGGEEDCYMDYLTFEVCWIVQVTDITAGYISTRGGPHVVAQDAFKECWDIAIALDVYSCAMEDRLALLSAVVYDDVGMPIGEVQYLVNVTPGENTFDVFGTVHVPKWAYPGENAMIYANAFTSCCPPGPQVLGVPWGPEASESIYIGYLVDETGPYPWGPLDGYCILSQLMYCFPMSPPILWDSWYRTLAVEALITDGVLSIDDVRNYLITVKIPAYCVGDPVAILVAAELACGYVH